MKKIFYITLLLFLVSISFTLAACTRESSKTTENKKNPETQDKKQEQTGTNTPLTDKKTPEVSQQGSPEGAGTGSQADLPKFSEIIFQKSYKDCDIAKEGCTNIQIYYPVMTGSAYADKINAMIKDMALHVYPIEGTHFSDFNELMNQFVKDYENFKKEVPDAASLGWYLKDSTSILTNTADIFCFENTSESFLGGAHGSYNVAYTNIDMRNGNVLKTKDIFNKGYENALNKLIEEKIRKHFEIKPSENLTDGGLFENKVSFNDNFAITKEGIEFLYNQYEIAPYAMGVIEVKFSYKELDGLLNKEVLKMNVL